MFCSISGIVFFDSGFFVLLLRYLKGIKVNKFSGYKFLKLLFNFLTFNKNRKIFLVDPYTKNSQNNLEYFQKLGCENIMPTTSTISEKIDCTALFTDLLTVSIKRPGLDI